MTKYLEEVRKGENFLALILRANFKSEGIEFFTPDNFSQQLAYMNRPKGYSIEPHYHNKVNREVQLTQEVLFLKSGKVRVDFYDSDTAYIESKVLLTGDVVLLASGGHGFKMLEESVMIEVKQGPFVGDEDKTRFRAVDDKKVSFTSQKSLLSE